MCVGEVSDRVGKQFQTVVELENMTFVYLLRSLGIPGRVYVGCASDVERRVRRHNWGECLATRDGRPWVVVFREGFEDRGEAFRRERQIKGWSREKKEALIAGDFERLRELARRRG